MGFIREYLEEINKFNINFEDSDLLELGDQEVLDHTLTNNFGEKLRNSNIFKTKSYTTFDLHEASGVTNFDLSLKYDKLNKYDIITNFGTIEHVEPETGQHNCWQNVHSMLKVGGYIINIMPGIYGGWEDHCRYYYSLQFFESFQDIGYKIVENKILNNLNIFNIMKKSTENLFFSEKQFWRYIDIRYTNNSNIIASTNNPKNLKF